MIRRIFIAFIFIQSTLGLSAQVQSLNKQVKYNNHLATKLCASHKRATAVYKAYQKLLEESHSYKQPSAFSFFYQLDEFYRTTGKELNTSYTKAMHDNYYSFEKQHADWMVYLKLEEYENDQGARGYELLKGMEKAVANVAAQRSVLRGNVLAQVSATPSCLDKPVYTHLVEIIQQQENIMEDIDEAFLRNPAIKLNEKLIIESYISTKKLLDDFNYQSADNKYMVNAIIGGLERLQSLKQSYVDKYNASEQRNNNYVLKFYQRYVDVFNNGVLYSFHQFVERGYQLVDYPQYIPSLMMYQVDCKVEKITTKFENLPYYPVNIMPQNRAISNEEFEILNGMVSALNARTRQVKNLRYSLDYAYIKLVKIKSLSPEARVALGNNYFRMETKNFELPKVDLAIIEQLFNEVLTNYKAPYMERMNSLQNLLLEYESLCEYLNDYGKNALFVTEGTEEAEKVMNRLIELSVLYEDKKEEIYRDIRMLYESYSMPEDQSWYKAYLEMLSACDNAKITTLQIQKVFYEGDTSAISTARIDDSRISLVKNQFENMKGITRIGSHNGHCPYAPYESLAPELNNLMETVNHLHDEKKSKYSTTDQKYIYRYNNMAEDLNKFSVIGLGDYFEAKKDKDRPVYLLQQTILSAPLKKEEVKIYKQPTNKEEAVRFSLEHKVNSFEGYADNNLVFLLDVSGSMLRENYARDMKESALFLTGMMRDNDDVAFVVFANKSQVIIETTPATKLKKLDNLLDDLKIGGKTNIYNGLKSAYQLADNNYKRKGNNQVVIATDGDVVISKKTKDLIVEYTQKDIQLTILVFGKTQTKELEALAKAGEGECKYLQSSNIDVELVQVAMAGGKVK